MTPAIAKAAQTPRISYFNEARKSAEAAPFDPRYQVWTHDAATVTPKVAEKIAVRILEQGEDHAFHHIGRIPTSEDRVLGFKATYLYVQGPVEKAFEEFDADFTSHANRKLVDTFLEPVRKQREETESARRKNEFEEKVQAFITLTPLPVIIVEEILKRCIFGERGAVVPSMSSRTEWFKQWLNRETDPFGTGNKMPPYQPEQSGYKLLLDRVITVSYIQDSYSDDSIALIPVEITEPTDDAAAQRNLNTIAEKIRTHNGWAGSGASYSLTLVKRDGQAFVLMSTRSSISD